MTLLKRSKRKKKADKCNDDDRLGQISQKSSCEERTRTVIAQDVQNSVKRVNRTSRTAFGKLFFKPHIAQSSVELGMNMGALVKASLIYRNWNRLIASFTVLQGQLRVNARDPGQCWVTSDDHQDYLILGAKDRNRALDGKGSTSGLFLNAS